MLKKLAQIGQRFKELREKKGYSINDMFRITGVYEADIALFEKGMYEPSTLELLRLVKAIGITLDDLID